MTAAPDLQASFAATLVDEWARCGVTDAVVAPGSRSTPLLLALAEGPLRLQVVLDERSAAFVALGIGLASGRPAVVVTTSGTAAAELHPAMVEAHQAGVPLLAVTADRPAELHRVGAPQTIEQDSLFAGLTRWSASPGVADAAAQGTWRSLAARAVAETIASPAGPGPVHLNLAFREPLLGTACAVPGGRPGGRPWHRPVLPVALPPPTDLVRELVGLAGRRGLIIAGSGSAAPGAGPTAPGAGGAGSSAAAAGGVSPAIGAVDTLAAGLGWPVLADPTSGARVPSPWTIAAADSLLRIPDLLPEPPEVVLRVGQPWASRVVTTWLRGLGSDVEQILVDPYGRWADPERQACRVVRCDVGALAHAVKAAGAGPFLAPNTWASRWARAESAAQAAIDQVLGGYDELTEPAIARALVKNEPAGRRLFVSSSMPVRDVEWFGRPHTGLAVLANRGANGIDGVISTALGIATVGPVTAVLGDLAFLYDVGALLGAARRPVDCLLVVIDNDGGGIFSFLPQASAVPADRFELLWGTPHGTDLARLAAAYGVPACEVSKAGDLNGALAGDRDGVRVVIARTDRGANVAVHEQLNSTVADAVRETLA